jgi:predicted nucleic acid-binding protein
MLGALPQAPVISREEVVAFLEGRRPQGRGLGWTDMHLLAAARVAGVPFWTKDKNLAKVAGELRLNPSEH